MVGQAASARKSEIIISCHLPFIIIGKTGGKLDLTFSEEKKGSRKQNNDGWTVGESEKKNVSASQRDGNGTRKTNKKKDLVKV